MVAAVRRTGRIVVLVLLAWTAVDLADHTLFAGAAGGTTAPVVTARSGAGHASPWGHADHSFCCSHAIDVRATFRLVLTLSPIGLLLAESLAPPVALSRALYHPPLAQA